MERVFEVTSRDAGSLRLREHDRRHFVAEVRAPDLQAHVQVETYMPLGGFAEWFEELAASWRGWSGKKVWRSSEGELELSAEGDRAGHIWLSAELRQAPPEGWRAAVTLLVEAGQLEGLAREARRFSNLLFSAV